MYNIREKIKEIDDTNIYYEAESMNKLETVINKELRKLHTWLIVNRLSLHIAKTNFLIFHSYNKPINQIITLKIHTRRYQKVNV